MKRSTERILTTHAGALPRSDELQQMIYARAEGARLATRQLWGGS